MTVKPSGLRAAAILAIAMFNAALEIPYGTFEPDPEAMTNSVEPAPDDIPTMTFAVPLRRRGRNALVACVTPTTLVRNCGHRGGLSNLKEAAIINSSLTEVKRSSSRDISSGLRVRPSTQMLIKRMRMSRSLVHDCPIGVLGVNHCAIVNEVV